MCVCASIMFVFFLAANFLVSEKKQIINLASVAPILVALITHYTHNCAIVLVNIVCSAKTSYKTPSPKKAANTHMHTKQKRNKKLAKFYYGALQTLSTPSVRNSFASIWHNSSGFGSKYTPEKEAPSFLRKDFKWHNGKFSADHTDRISAHISNCFNCLS